AGAFSTSFGSNFFRLLTPIPLMRKRSESLRNPLSLVRSSTMDSARLSPIPGNVVNSVAVARLRMRRPSGSLAALVAPGEASPDGSPGGESAGGGHGGGSGGAGAETGGLDVSAVAVPVASHSVAMTPA